MNKKMKAVIAFLLAVITAFSTPVLAMAAVTTTSKYTGKVYTHNAKLQKYSVINVIDVSSHNGSSIDWTKVKNDGIEYAIIRVGFTGYTKSKHSLNYDTYYEQNITGAINAGIPVGVYWYSQALNESEAKAEANYLLSAIKGYDIELPVYFDYEFAGRSEGRLDSAWSTGALNKTKMTANTRAFCETVKAAGYTAGVYANAYFLSTNIDGAGLASSYPIWLAHYTTQSNYSGDYDMWQYTDTGKVNGINDTVDCNFLYNKTKVTGIYVAGRGDDGARIRLAWNAVKDATGYKIYQKISGEYVEVGTSATPDYNVTGLHSGWEYYFKVSAIVNGEESDLSDEFHTVAACASPTGITAEAVSDNQISVKWDAGSAHGYYLEWSTDPTFKTNKQSANLVGVNNTSKTITVNGNAKDYYVRVRLWRYWEDGYVYGNFSNAVKVAKVTGLYTAGRGGDGSTIRLAWDAVDGATEYNIYQKISGKYEQIGTSKTTDFNATELHSGWEYYFKVSAIVDGKEVGMSDEFHTVAACASPTGFTVEAVSENQISVKWDAGSAHGYYLEWSTDPTFKTNKQSANLVGVNNTSKTITVNGNAGDYYVRVRLWRYWEDGYVYGSFSQAEKVYKVTGLYTAGRGGEGSTIRLAWNAVDGATEYKIYQKISGEYIEIGMTETTDFNAKELHSGWEYYFKVSAMVDGKEVGMSDEFHTVAACASPTGLTAKVVSDNEISVTWDVGSAHGYYLEWSTDPTFATNKQSANLVGVNNTSKTIKVNGNAGDYYVRVRLWRYWEDGYVYGSFSQALKVENA